MTARPIIWSIAGNDSGGGAGSSADLLTGQDFGVHVCPLLSAVTAQNSLGLQGVEPVSLEIFQAQLESLAADLPARAIKIGLLPSSAHVHLLADWLAGYRQQQPCFVIYDPVAITSSGDAMTREDLRPAILERLLPQLDLLTPNASELAWLLESAPLPPDVDALEAAAARLRERGVGAVLCKGGHLAWPDALALDYFSDGKQRFALQSSRLGRGHDHGTGCTLASAIAALMALEFELPDALTLAKSYVQQGLRLASGLGQGPGPVAHVGWPADARDLPLPRWARQVDGRWQLESLAAGEPFAATEHALGLYPVVDSVAWLERLLAWGVRTLQLRIKDPAAVDLEIQIQAAVALGRRHDARLFINDHWQLALRHGAYGVHLGQEDLETADLAAIRAGGLRLGLSTHGFFEIARARAMAPSYLALGHIFPTRTKQMPSQPQGLWRLERYAQLLQAWPTVAIGGISEERVAAVQATGVGSIALVTAITEAGDPEAVTRRLLAQVEGEARHG